MMLDRLRIPPPPRPWTAIYVFSNGRKEFRRKNILRAPIIIFMFCAAPAKALPRAKMVMEMSMIGFRPKIFARLPVRGRIAVLANEYADPTQTKSSPPLRSSVMVGRETETPVRSTALRNRETITAINDIQNEEPGLNCGASVGDTSRKVVSLDASSDLEVGILSKKREAEIANGYAQNLGDHAFIWGGREWHAPADSSREQHRLILGFTTPFRMVFWWYQTIQ